MAFTQPRTWNAGEVVTAQMMNQQVRDNLNVLKIFERGGTMFNAAGITAGANIIVWEAVEPSNVTYFKGYRVGGTGATINARKNGASNHLAVALSLAVADVWTPGSPLQNVSYVTGDKLEIMLVSVTANPTQVAIVVGLSF